MADQNDYDKQLANMMNSLADSVLELSDEELLAEVRKEGIDPRAEAGLTRELLRQVSRSQRLKKLEEAQLEYERQIAEMRAKQYELPTLPSKQRQLLAAVFAARPEMQTALLTAQHRDFQQLADSDVESFLRQLKELGVLDELELPEL